MVYSPETFGALSSPSLSVSVSPSLGSPVIYQSCCQIVHARTFRLVNTCLLCAITTSKYPLNFGSHPERSLVVKLVIRLSMPKFGGLSQRATLQKVNISSFTSFTLHCSAGNSNLVTFLGVEGEKAKGSYLRDRNI